jgi:peptidoglycan/xylan/chitin deacetylase (PgdA/CDA1 family)
MKVILIYHEGAKVNEIVITRWLNSFSNLSGLVVIKEAQSKKINRIKIEIRRVGVIRFLDILIYKLYYKIFLDKKDKRWLNIKIKELIKRYPELKNDIPLIVVDSPNNIKVKDFINKINPDIVIARVKVLLSPEIFLIPKKGTYIFHPGICPEYRNSHGCFWALANRDMNKVGMSLVKIDKGIDTGPIHGFFYADFDEKSDSHIVIQNKVVLDNLFSLEKELLKINNETSFSIDTKESVSNTWGQPWMTKYVYWKFNAFLNGKKIVSLIYHDIYENDKINNTGFMGDGPNKYKLTKQDFIQHLEVISHITKTCNNIEIILTFDDGGKSFYDISKILDSYNIKGIFFISTSFVSESNFVNENEIIEIHSRGHIIGSHSHTHPKNISKLNFNLLLKEWNISRKILENILKVKIEYASIPGGFISNNVLESAGQSGFKYIFTSEPLKGVKRNDYSAVYGRYTITSLTSISDLQDILNSRLSITQFKQLINWNFKKILKRILGDKYLIFRKHILKKIKK